MSRHKSRHPGQGVATNNQTSAPRVPLISHGVGQHRLSSPRCPDCGVVGVGNSLTHDETCPIGREAAATMDADRVFFEEHPAATEYRRPVTQAEAVEQRTSGAWPDVPGRVAGRVLVTQIKPGLRTRSFSDVFIVLIEGGAL